MTDPLKILVESCPMLMNHHQKATPEKVSIENSLFLQFLYGDPPRRASWGCPISVVEFCAKN